MFFREPRLVGCGRLVWCEWAFESERKDGFVWYVSRSGYFVIKGRHMIVCAEWIRVNCIKPGGTAVGISEILELLSQHVIAEIGVYFFALACKIEPSVAVRFVALACK